MTNYNLSGKRALVTGGSHGIGVAIAKKLAHHGVDVAILSRTQIELEKSSKELSSLGVKSIFLVCDVLSTSSVLESWKNLEKQWYGVDILINNVGGGGRWGSENILDTPDEVWSEVFQKNAGVATQLTTLAIPYMQDKKWGRVITVTSIYGENIGGRPWFNVAKVAQTTFIKNLAQVKDFVRSGITFNAVAPGSIFIEETGWDKMQRENPREYIDFKEKLPLGRLGTADEVASAVVFLCSTEANYINGISLTVDGGESKSFL
jgi:3-oxoacyl-[acyl-carrier protein] reductase